MARRPARPLSLLQMLRAMRGNWLAGCDEALFDEMIVERRLGWRRYVVVNDPDGIRRILQENLDNYPRHRAVRRVFAFETGTGMLCGEGEVWRRHRRIVNPTMDHRALLADLPALGGLAEQMADHIAALPEGEEIDVLQAFLVWIIASAGQVFAGGDREIDLMVDRMGTYPKDTGLLHFVPLPDWVPGLRRYRSGPDEARRFQPLLDALIAARRRPDRPAGGDLLSRLAHARDREDGASLSDAELRDEMITLGATSRSTLRPLTWLWYLLDRHPWAEERLHEELDRVLGGRAPRAEDLPRLVYLRRVIDETMRLYPPLPIFIPRVAAADDAICGHRVPKNAIVMIIPWILHRHRRLWRDPDLFDPDRFAPDAAAARSRYAYLPFAIGPHVCVGASLALMQIMTIVAVLAQRFRFRLVPGPPLEPTGWIHLSVNRPIRVTAEPRRAAASARRTGTGR